MINPLRQSPTRKLIALGALLAWGMDAAQAQDQAEPPDGDAPPVAIVQGLSADDLLNVRATASPIGLVLARIPNGTLLTRLECSTSRNIEWCRVEVPDLDGLVGWTPARYLRFARADGEAEEEAPAPLPGRQVIDPSKITVGILPDPLPMPEDPLAELAATPGVSDLQTALLAPAADGPAVFDAAREAQKIDGAAADLALAYATRRDPAASEVYSALGSEADPAPAGETDAAGTAAAATAMPVPSPRPPREVAPEPSPAADPVVAALPSPDTAMRGAAAAAPVAAERDLPAAGQKAAEPVVEADPAPAREAADAGETPPGASPPETPAAPERSVALAPPRDGADDLPTVMAAVEERPDAAPAQPSPAIEPPVAAADDAGSSDRTLREQLAALLPSWSRPRAPADPEPGTPAPRTDEGQPREPRDAGSEAVPEAAAGSAATTAPLIAPPAAPPPVPAAPAIVPPVPAAPAAVPPSPPAAVPPIPAPPATVLSIPAAPAAVADTRPVETVAQLQPVEPAASAAPGRAAELACARYVGQPMTRCEARILRLGPDDADVTVLWPDGGERLIRFRGGQPDSTNTRGEFRFTREAELNLIRIGAGERFEILDALPFAE